MYKYVGYVWPGAYGGDEQQLVRCSTAVVRPFSGS